MVKRLFGLIAAFLLIGSSAFAAVGVKDEGSMLGAATDINIVGSNIVATTDGSTVTITVPNKTRTVELPLLGFTTNGAPITGSTAPGLEIDNLIPGVVWADGETTPIQGTFTVPADYLSGGTFRLFCDSSSSTTPAKVDFSVYVNGDGSTWDAAATDQTAVALVRAAGSPEQVTLTVGTDFSGLVAGKRVTLNLWRDDVSTGTGDLEISGIAFEYTGD